ncbi:MAG: hypothetical protein M1818_004174 [Claussenomyces sp. TS43310]|nr:MAG: hypothetical protein M1818_004174 [Claussenomyces sp. TS43310]
MEGGEKKMDWAAHGGVRPTTTVQFQDGVLIPAFLKENLSPLLEDEIIESHDPPCGHVMHVLSEHGISNVHRGSDAPKLIGKGDFYETRSNDLRWSFADILISLYLMCSKFSDL